MNKQDIQTVLNALQNSQLFVQASSNINVLEGFGQQLDDADEAIALLRAFLAEPSEAEHEPVAWQLGHRFYTSLKDAEYAWRNDCAFLGTSYVPEPLFTRPASKPSEPVMIYHGGCTIDCGEHGHHNMEMLKLIPAGTKLFTHPASKPEPSEPVYWQWRRKDKPWANEYIFAMELQATTDDSEVRKLFTHPASKPEPLTDEEILLAISPFYKDTLTRRAAIEVSIDEYRAIEQAVISRIKP